MSSIALLAQGEPQVVVRSQNGPSFLDRPSTPLQTILASINVDPVYLPVVALDEPL